MEPDFIGAFADVIAQRVVARLALGTAEQAAPQIVWLTPREASEYVRLSYKRLENLRHDGGGPEFERHGRRVRYARTALDAWIAQRNGKRKGAA